MNNNTHDSSLIDDDPDDVPKVDGLLAAFDYEPTEQEDRRLECMASELRGQLYDLTTRIKKGGPSKKSLLAPSKDDQEKAKVVLEDFVLRQRSGLPQLTETMRWLKEVFQEIVDGRLSPELALRVAGSGKKGRPSSACRDWHIALWVKIANVNRGYKVKDAIELAARVWGIPDFYTTKRAYEKGKKFVGAEDVSDPYYNDDYFHRIHPPRPLPDAK